MIFFCNIGLAGLIPFSQEKLGGEVMTFFEKGNGEMGNDFLQNRIGGANAFSAENIFVVFSFKLTPHRLLFVTLW